MKPLEPEATVTFCNTCCLNRLFPSQLSRQRAHNHCHQPKPEPSFTVKCHQAAFMITLSCKQLVFMSDKPSKARMCCLNPLLSCSYWSHLAHPF